VAGEVAGALALTQRRSVPYQLERPSDSISAVA